MAVLALDKITTAPPNIIVAAAPSSIAFLNYTDSYFSPLSDSTAGLLADCVWDGTFQFCDSALPAGGQNRPVVGGLKPGINCGCFAPSDLRPFWPEWIRCRIIKLLAPRIGPQLNTPRCFLMILVIASWCVLSRRATWRFRH